MFFLLLYTYSFVVYAYGFIFGFHFSLWMRQITVRVGDVCFFDEVLIGQRFKALDNIFSEIASQRNYSVRVCLIMTYAIHTKHNFKIRLNGQQSDAAVNVWFDVYTQVTLRADVYCRPLQLYRLLWCLKDMLVCFAYVVKKLLDFFS